jgi:hypothetical protein
VDAVTQLYAYREQPTEMMAGIQMPADPAAEAAQ